MASITKLVQSYERNLPEYRSVNYSEAQLRIDYLDPFLKLLGWDIHNTASKNTNEREVLVEESLRASKNSNIKKPDYTFRLFSDRKFFLEAKKPHVDISLNSEPAKQVRRYGFTAKLKISVLTNFEYLAIYDCSSQVEQDQSAPFARIKLYHYTDYESQFHEIKNLIGKDSVYSGCFDETWASIEENINRFSVDDLFLQQINEWRLQLAIIFSNIKTDIDDAELNDLTQSYINSIVFLRVCEDRELEEYEDLYLLSKTEDYSSFIKKLSKADKKYNSGLFDLPYIQEFISDKNSYIWEIVKQLYFPESPFSFSVFSSDILGNIYEIFLGKKITHANDAVKLIPKSENIDRDIVTTPTHIIKDILKRTVVEFCQGKSDQEILASKFADIACGSGAFLLELFQMLQDILVDYYVTHDNTKLNPVTSNSYRLKFKIKRQLLVSCIYGIDKDLNAVKAAQFGLLLKLLEGENNSSITLPALPILDHNILFGNSLIESKDVLDIDLEEINPFNFNCKFDVIIGNPPYLATENIKELTPKELPIYKERYHSAYKQFDKYYLFVERSLSLMNESGYFGYILPSKFMKVGAGKNLRGFLSKNKYVSEVVSFGANQIFKNKTTYTCLLFARKHRVDTFPFVEVKSLTNWKVRSKKGFDQCLVEANDIKSDTWILEKETQALLSIIRNKTLPLLEILAPKSIENGIQTSANKVYIHQPINSDQSFIYFKYQKMDYKVEKELTRPYFKTIRGTDTLYSYKDVVPNSMVIYPYKKNGGEIKLISLNEIQSEYPFMYQFLMVIRDILAKDSRDIQPTPTTDNEWHRYGRSQSLENCDVAQKIVVGVLSNGYKYSIDNHRTFISSGGTAGYCPINVSEQCDYSIYYIQALLNSKYLEWFASLYGEIFRGGYIARGTKVLKRMPIIPIDFNDQNKKKQHDDIASLQEKLNLAYSEIKIVKSFRVKVPLQRRFDILINEMDEKLKRLFDLGQLDEKIPSISQIYNTDDD